MLRIIFSTAKNGSRTCSDGNVLLHSAYNPEQEAERFVNSITCSFNPSFILILEPALSYCSSFLRLKYPDKKILAVRYSEAFSFCDNLWDKIFPIYDISVPFEELLFNELGEEGIFSTLFLSWTPSARAFPDIDNSVWSEIKKAVLKSRDILYTRSFFGSRWTSNIFTFCRYLSKTSFPVQKGTCAIVITASGPSLSGTLPLLRKYRRSFFLVAVSSSLSVLLNNHILPDMCISTDGGYYAEAHLMPYENGRCSVPLALSAESFCKKKVIADNTIIPLMYNDGLSASLLPYCGIQGVPAQRNGTVSGTAAEFALNITTGPVFFCGLDLDSSSGYQHAQPNLLETVASSVDNHISPKETRISASRFSTGALSVYSNWFKSLAPEKTKRLFRLSDHFNFSNTLGSIKDIDFNFFGENIQENKFPSFMDTLIPTSVESSEREFIKKNKYSDEWLHSIFPVEYLVFQRSSCQIDSEKRRNILEEKNNALLCRLERILHE
ncbi:MAG: DUF115 domain-containing protein [Treponema sp.]|nr:DUF115 domain-containing protein [Treponema sp.]